LQEAVIPFRKTHDLPALLNMLITVEPTWTRFGIAMNVLTDYSVDPRYPGLRTDKAKAKQAVKFCRDFRRACRLSLKLPP
jgi:hypothetical protein